MVTIETALTCYHCGEDCKDEVIRRDDKVFCCEGCKLVFEILQENNLCSYYQYNASPGQSPKGRFLEEKYAFLDDDQVRKNWSTLLMVNTRQSIFTFLRCIAAVVSGCWNT